MSNAFSSIEDLLDGLYATISGPAGPRPWSREHELFHPLARLMRTGADESGRPWIKIMSVNEYIADVARWLEAHDFYEVEVSRQIERFGNIAQVRSVYEARRSPDDEQVERRGVNLIQIFNDGARWWVLSVAWDNEREGVRIPDAWTNILCLK